MTLGEFDKVNTSPRTEYTVYSSDECECACGIFEGLR